MPEEFSSLIHLANKLKSRGVPTLTVLIAELAGYEDYVEFRRLVKEFLPEREQDILHKTTPGEQVASFASYFEDRYFPLEPFFRMGDIESYQDLTRCIIPLVLGIGWEEYDSIASDARDGIQLMTYLLENPQNGEVNVSLAEACASLVPKSLIQRVPENRLSPEEAHKLLDGTPYEGLALWADRVFLGSGNLFLDTDDEMLWNNVLPEWEIDEVQDLTTEWLRAKDLDNRMWDFVDWLEADLPGHFEELLTFILERRVDEQKPT